jgi:hypothetical protein
MSRRERTRRDRLRTRLTERGASTLGRVDSRSSINARAIDVVFKRAESTGFREASRASRSSSEIKWSSISGLPVRGHLYIHAGANFISPRNSRGRVRRLLPSEGDGAVDARSHSCFRWSRQDDRYGDEPLVRIGPHPRSYGRTHSSRARRAAVTLWGGACVVRIRLLVATESIGIRPLGNEEGDVVETHAALVARGPLAGRPCPAG